MNDELVQKALEAKAAQQQMLNSKPNVVGMDVGFKYVGGKRTSQVAVRVFVNKKQDVGAADAIPATIDGVPTDVIEQEEIELQVTRRPDKPLVGIPLSPVDPLVGGVSIGACRSINGLHRAGTLGAIVQDSPGLLYALSCFHTLGMDNQWKVGDKIAQPSVLDGGKCTKDTIGGIANACLATVYNCNGKSVDAAICTVNRGVNDSIKNIGKVLGTARPVLGATVRKQGRTTGLTYGTIDGIAGSFDH